MSGLLSGVLMALDTVVLGIIMTAPVYREADGFRAALACSFLHSMCSALWSGIYLAAHRELKGLKRALSSKGGFLVLVSAMLGGPLGMVAYMVSINLIGASYTAAVSALYPAVAAWFSHFFLKEKMTRTQVAGLCLSMAAVLILGITSGSEPGAAGFAGFAVAGIACIGWALEAVIFSAGFEKSGMSEVQTIFLRQVLCILVSGGILLPVTHSLPLAGECAADFSMLRHSYGALFITGSYIFYYRAIDGIGAAKATALNITYTAWTIIFSALFLKEWPGLIGTLCVFVIIAGSLTAGTAVRPLRLQRLRTVYNKLEKFK